MIHKISLSEKKLGIQIADWNSGKYFIEILSQRIATTVNLRLQTEFRAMNQLNASFERVYR